MAGRREVIRQFLPASPFAAHLGIELVAIEPGRAELRLPFRSEHATLGDVVHGGAIAALLDTAGMAAAWSGDEEAPSPAGATTDLHVSYVAAARGEDLTAVAEVVRQGRSLCFVEVTVSGPAGVVAKGLMTHRYG